MFRDGQFQEYLENRRQQIDQIVRSWSRSESHTRSRTPSRPTPTVTSWLSARIALRAVWRTFAGPGAGTTYRRAEGLDVSHRCGAWLEPCRRGNLSGPRSGRRPLLPVDRWTHRRPSRSRALAALSLSHCPPVPRRCRKSSRTPDRSGRSCRGTMRNADNITGIVQGGSCRVSRAAPHALRPDTQM